MPTQDQFKFDPYLGNFSLGYQNGNYIGDQVATPVSVGAPTGQYVTFGREHFRVHETRRADRSRANEIDWTFGTAKFETVRHSLLATVSDTERDLAVKNMPGVNLALEQESVEVATDGLLLEREDAIATALRASSVLGAEVTLSGTSQWSDYTNSNPFTQIAAARTSIQTKIGKLPNTVIIPFPVVEILSGHPLILNRMSVTSDKIVQPDLLARLFMVDNVLMPTVVKDSANFGAAFSSSSVWGKDVIFAYVDGSAGQKKQTLAKTFEYNPGRPPVKRWREEDREIDVFEVNRQYGIYIVSSGAGYMIRNAVA